MGVVDAESSMGARLSPEGVSASSESDREETEVQDVLEEEEGDMSESTMESIENRCSHCSETRPFFW